jgi:hypothetical protein
MALFRLRKAPAQEADVGNKDTSSLVVPTIALKAEPEVPQPSATIGDNLKPNTSTTATKPILTLEKKKDRIKKSMEMKRLKKEHKGMPVVRTDNSAGPRMPTAQIPVRRGWWETL